MAKREPLRRASQGSGLEMRSAALARQEAKNEKVSRAVRDDASIVRTPSKFCNISAEISISATKGHTSFLNAPWTEHDCLEVCFRCNSHLVRNTLAKVGNPTVASPK